MFMRNKCIKPIGLFRLNLKVWQDNLTAKTQRCKDSNIQTPSFGDHVI